jgi:hypothetical protein
VCQEFRSITALCGSVDTADDRFLPTLRSEQGLSHGRWRPGVCSVWGKRYAPSANADTVTARSSRHAALLAIPRRAKCPASVVQYYCIVRGVRALRSDICRNRGPRRVHARSLTRITMSRVPKQRHWRGSWLSAVDPPRRSSSDCE